MHEVNNKFLQNKSDGLSKYITLVRFFAFMLFISAILQVAGAVNYLFILNKTLRGGIALVVGLILLPISLGIYLMKRWALYLLTILSVFSVAETIYSFIHTQDVIEFLSSFGLMFFMMLYLWAVFMKFTNHKK